MAEKTSNYSIFKIRGDNRAIAHRRVQLLQESISKNNMLAYRPILVNEKMEILDGQHRLKAAEKLNIPIYYEIKKTSKAEDIIALNIQTPWSLKDFLNYFVSNCHDEYLKLREYMDENNLSLRIALNSLNMKSKECLDLFKMGKFKFDALTSKEDLETVQQTVAEIIKWNSWSSYLYSAKFYSAVFKMIRHPDFDKETWFRNISKLSSRFRAQVTQEDYLRLCLEIYNFHNKTHKISFDSLKKEKYDSSEDEAMSFSA